MAYPTLWFPNEGHHVTGLGWLLDRAATLEGHGLVGPQMHLIWLSFVVSDLLFVSPLLTGVSQMEHGLASRQKVGRLVLEAFLQ